MDPNLSRAPNQAAEAVIESQSSDTNLYDLGFLRDLRLDLNNAQTDHKQNTTGFLRGSGKPYSTGPQEGRSVPKSTRQSSAQKQGYKQ